MATINQIARSRKALFENLKRADRTIDSIQEAIQRHIGRVLARKRKFPETGDVVRLADLVQLLDGAVETLTGMVESTEEFFSNPEAGIDQAGLRDFWRDLVGRTGRNVIAMRNKRTGAIVVVRFKTEAAMRRWLDENPQFEFAYDLRQGGRGDAALEAANP